MVRDRVGGGGKEKPGFDADWARLWAGEAPLVPWRSIAGGGRLKELSVTAVGDVSLPWISVEAAGVGGRLVRGIIDGRLWIYNQGHVSKTEKEVQEPETQAFRIEEMKFVSRVERKEDVGIQL